MKTVADDRPRCAWGRGWLSLLTLVASASLLAAPAGAIDVRDTDLDGMINEVDNCRYLKNADQLDADMDRVGDACDKCLGTEADVPAGVGSLRLVVNPFGCSLTQLCPCDGPRGKLRTWRRRSHYLRCIRTASHQLTRLRILGSLERQIVVAQAQRSKCGLVHGVPGDRDGDGVLDDGDGDGTPGDNPCASKVTVGCDDNCPRRRNPRQKDLDKDGKGDLCDGEVDGDKIPNVRDNCPRVANPLQEDGDKDGVGDVCDDCKESKENADVNSRGCE